MNNRAVLITGTPCVGKTTVAKELARQLGAFYVNLTEFTKKHNLILSEDKERQTLIVDEKKMRKKLATLLNITESDTVIDGHYAAAVTPRDKVTKVFVLRRNPVELREFMKKCRFNDKKLKENLACEILDVCLCEALREQDEEKICELDTTGKNVQEIVAEIIAVLQNLKKCRAGCIDWLGMLETQGILDRYLEE